MLITFRSDAEAEVLMLGEHAQVVLELLGKDPASPEGIITVAQLPEAIRTLQEAIAHDRAAARSDDADDQDADTPGGMAAPVALAARAWPLLNMLQASERDSVPVIWHA